LRDVVVATQERFVKGDCPRADLVVPLIVGKKEEFVFFDRPSDRAAVLPTDEEGVFQTLKRAGGIAQRAASSRVAGTF
jgi:hypothetical protein